MVDTVYQIFHLLVLESMNNMNLFLNVIEEKKNEEKTESNEGASTGKSKRRFPDFG